MISPQELVQDVRFTEDIAVGALQWNEHYGFLQVAEDALAINGIRLIGFATPIARSGGYDLSDKPTLITEFNDLPAEFQNIDSQGKGVGTRMYNIRQAHGGAKVNPGTIGVYSFDLSPARIRDERSKQGSKVSRIGRHAGRILRSKLSSTEQVVQGIHESYGDVDAVALEMPPLPELRQVKHGVKNPAGVTPQFIIIRNPHVAVRKIGETDAAW